MTGGSNSIVETAPPMAHAVGGSLGSALALLLLYPLERARVEMQTMTAATSTAVGKDINDKVQPLQSQAPASRGGDLDPPHQANPSKRILLPNNTPEATGTNQLDESWESLLRTSYSITEAMDADPSLSPEKQHPSKLGLLACLYQLHQRNQLYRGVTPVVTTMALSNFVFFYFHSYLQQWLRRKKTSSSAAANLQLSLVASSLAGIANVLLTNPLWVANLRIVTSGSNTQTNLWNEIRSIIQQEGWQHLWNGTPASLLLVSNPVLQFVSYEQLKNQLQSLRHTAPHSALRPLEAFLLGALAKAISTVLTYPLQLAQTVLRVQKDDSTTAAIAEASESEPLPDKKHSTKTLTTTHTQTTQPTVLPPYKGTLDCLVQIYRQKGMEGWFAGMRTKLLQTVLTAAFTFLTYEQIIRAIMSVHKAWQENASSRTLAAATRDSPPSMAS